MSNDTQDMTKRIVPTPWGDFEVSAHVEREPYRIGEDFKLAATARVADFDRFNNGYENIFTGAMVDPIIINGKSYPASTCFTVTARSVWGDYRVDLTESARRQLAEHLSPVAGEMLESAEVREEVIHRWAVSEAEYAEREVERAREQAARQAQRVRDLIENAPALRA